MVSPKGGTNGARIDDAARPPHESLDEAITEYLMACDVESKRPRSIHAYEETLRVFRRVVSPRGAATQRLPRVMR